MSIRETKIHPYVITTSGDNAGHFEVVVLRNQERRFFGAYDSLNEALAIHGRWASLCREVNDALEATEKGFEATMGEGQGRDKWLREQCNEFAARILMTVGTDDQDVAWLGSSIYLSIDEWFKDWRAAR